MLNPIHAALPQTAGHERLRAAARELEAGFLAEMLRHGGLGSDGGGTGIGGEQMASFRIRIQADALVAAGGIGLAEALFESLVRRSGP